MNIIYIIDHLRPDGTQNFLLRLTEGLAARGHHQVVVCLNDSYDDFLLGQLKKNCQRIEVIGWFFLLSGIGFYRLWRILCQEEIDVVVTLLFYSDVLGRTLAHFAGVKRIITSLRARNIHYSILQRRLVRFSMQWVDAVVLNSSYFKDFAILEEGAQLEKIFIIPNGVDVERFGKIIDRYSLKKSLDIPDDAFLIGSVGRLDPQKGYDLLISALAFLKHCNVHLMLVGEGAQEGNLRSQAQDLGISERVHFVGFHRDIPDLMNLFDVYVQPSRFEGMPNALLEAMAAGCLVVASAVDGNLELVQDGINGWLFPSEDIRSLSQVLLKISNHKDELKERGFVAKKQISEKFNASKMVTSWEQLIKGL